MRQVTRTVVQVELPPLCRASGHVYVHEAALDGDENLQVGQRIEVLDEGGACYPAEVAGRDPGPLGPTWTIRLLCDARV